MYSVTTQDPKAYVLYMSHSVYVALEATKKTLSNVNRYRIQRSVSRFKTLRADIRKNLTAFSPSVVSSSLLRHMTHVKDNGKINVSFLLFSTVSQAQLELKPGPLIRTAVSVRCDMAHASIVPENTSALT